MATNPDIVNVTADEGTPLQSKKFLAFIMAELGWKAVIILTIVFLWNRDQMDGLGLAFVMTLVLVNGFVEVGFILGQASLDKFIRLAKIAAATGARIRPKMPGVEILDGEEPGKPG